MISFKKPYEKPVVEKINIDNSISMVMMSNVPGNPDPLASGKKGQQQDTPFASPFDNKPFN
jgi:hypothetical protein